MQEIDMAQEKVDIRKILLIGSEGTGKTHFIGTMPKPVYLFSFDKGYKTLAGVDGIKVGVFMDEDRYRPRAYAEFKMQFDKFKRGELTYNGEPYKTIAIDSITALSKFLLDHEQKVNNTIDKPGGFGVWGNIKSRLSDIVVASVLRAEYAVFTAQIETEKDELTGEIFYKPSTEGSFRNEMGQWMDAVFFMQVDKDMQGNKTYKMLTVGDRRQKAKIRIPSAQGKLVEAAEEPDFERLIKKLAGSQPQTQTTQGGKQ